MKQEKPVPETTDDLTTAELDRLITLANHHAALARQNWTGDAVMEAIAGKLKAARRKRDE